METVCRCIASGFFPNAAYLHYSGVYKTVRGGEDLYVHPTSILYSVEQPPWYVVVLRMVIKFFMNKSNQFLCFK